MTLFASRIHRAAPWMGAVLLGGLVAGCTSSAVTTEHVITVDGTRYKVFETDYTSSVSDEVDYKIVLNGIQVDCTSLQDCADRARRQARRAGAPPPATAPATSTKPAPTGSH